MEKLTILTADLLDILFENRNKSYGAYELRKTYPKRIAYAIAGTFFICLLFIAGTIMANAKKMDEAKELVTDYELQNFKKEEPKPEPPPQTPPPKQETPKVEISTFTPPKIVKEEIKPEEEMKDIDKLEATRIGAINQEGIKDDGVILAPVEKSTGIVGPPKIEKDVDEIFTVVQLPAHFPGDADGWRKYLERNLNSALPSDNGAPPASYTVIISFVVDRTGAISDVKAENDPGFGTKAEAIRVILKKSPLGTSYPEWK